MTEIATCRCFRRSKGHIIFVQMGGWGAPSACTLIEETRRALLPPYLESASVTPAFVFQSYVASVGEEALAWRTHTRSSHIQCNVRASAPRASSVT